MNYGTFLKSALSLAPHWPRQALIGEETADPKLAMARLRQVGQEMERAMTAATGGVNTHKGLIFALSLLLWAGAANLREGLPLDSRSVTARSSRLVEGCVAAELEPLRRRQNRPLSHGERLFLLHGVTGIRGEAEGAFPSITGSGLPALKLALADGASLEEAALDALLALMTVCEDSNVIHRGGYAYWKETYRAEVSTFRRRFTAWDDRKRQNLLELDRLFLQRRISPGGAADLLACTLFLFWLESPPFATSCQQ
jgi:triphosphoribosyl-dephospho-CoA synthetase